ncbi:MAG: hypothetical protein RQ757_10290 [Pseudomonadales bacterium]|nr:hypothetical protein [Pseudomonadales bacterium]
MKSHQWDDIADNSKDFFDSVGFIPDAEIEDNATDKRVQKQRLTEMRRRIEERLDWKRMYGELQLDDDGVSTGRYASDLDDYNDLDDTLDEH